MKFDMRQVKVDDIDYLFEIYHPYGSVGKMKTYAFGVYEDDRLVAAYTWLPPAVGSAKATCPEAPEAVLALSRMVAVPKSERRLKHISKPLKEQFKIIDRSRYPVLITYSDESKGHTGYVYQCAGMTKTFRSKVRFYQTTDGNRVSAYSNGKMRNWELTQGGTAYINRWEHWACERGKADEYMILQGWERQPIPGKFWASGNPASRFVRIFTP